MRSVINIATLVSYARLRSTATRISRNISKYCTTKYTSLNVASVENVLVRKINCKVMSEFQILVNFRYFDLFDFRNTHTGAKPFGCKYEYCQFRSGDLSAVSKHQKKCSHNPMNMGWKLELNSILLNWICLILMIEIKCHDETFQLFLLSCMQFLLMFRYRTPIRGFKRTEFTRIGLFPWMRIEME